MRKSILKNNFFPGHYNDALYLSGKLLVAMPYLKDSRFHQSVIYICEHDNNGAMGIILNKPLSSLMLKDLLRQLNVGCGVDCKNFPVIYGGPMDISRGFVIHTLDWQSDSTKIIDNSRGLTSTLDILRALSQGEGPHKSIVSLGYASWSPGQLENEVQLNEWLIIEATEQMLFHIPYDDRWRLAMASIGVNPSMLSLECGRA